MNQSHQIKQMKLKRKRKINKHTAPPPRPARHRNNTCQQAINKNFTICHDPDERGVQALFLTDPRDTFPPTLTPPTRPFPLLAASFPFKADLFFARLHSVYLASATGKRATISNCVLRTSSPFPLFQRRIISFLRVPTFRLWVKDRPRKSNNEFANLRRANLGWTADPLSRRNLRNRTNSCGRRYLRTVPTKRQACRLYIASSFSSCPQTHTGGCTTGADGYCCRQVVRSFNFSFYCVVTCQVG